MSKEWTRYNSFEDIKAGAASEDYSKSSSLEQTIKQDNTARRMLKKISTKEMKDFQHLKKEGEELADRRRALDDSLVEAYNTKRLKSASLIAEAELVIAARAKRDKNKGDKNGSKTNREHNTGDN